MGSSPFGLAQLSDPFLEDLIHSGYQPKGYLQLEVAYEEQNESNVFLGRIHNNTIQWLNADQELITYEFGPSKRIIEPEKPTVALPKKKLSPSVLRKEKLRLPHTVYQAHPTDLDHTAVFFEMTSQEMNQCTNLKTFKNFISQLHLLKGVTDTFEVTVANSNQIKCGFKVLEHILKKGFRAYVAIGKLPKGGLSARAYLKTGRPQRTDDPDDYFSDSLRQRQQFDEFVVNISTQGGLNFQLRPNLDGFFMRSFSPMEIQRLFPLKVEVLNRNKKVASFQTKEIPRFTLGSHSKMFFDTDFLRVIKNNWDSARIMKISPDYLADLLKKKEKEFNKFRFFMGFHTLLLRDNKNNKDFFIPLMISNRYTATSKIFFQSDAVVPYSTDPSLVYSRIDIDANYWIVGEESRWYAKKSRRYNWGVGLGGFFLHFDPQDRKKLSGLLLTDFMGIYLNHIFEIIIEHHKWKVFLESEISPVPETQFTTQSLSWGTSLGTQYCLKFDSCFVLQAIINKYEISLINQPSLETHTQQINFGYRFSFD